MDTWKQHLLTQKVYAEVVAACPGADLRIGNPEDKGTWEVRPPDGATPAQIAAAKAVITGFNLASLDVPQTVKMWQAKAALAAQGKLEAANAAIAQAGNSMLLAAWEYAPDVSRDSAGLNAVAGLLGLSQADVDALFIQAAALKV